MSASKYETTFPSEIFRVKQIISEILRFVKEAMPAATEADIFELRLIFMELLCNAVIHGNRQDVSKCVHICIEISKDTIQTQIMDEGIGFDYMKLLGGFSDANNLDGEHGRGIRLVYSLTDTMIFNTEGNEIKFFKRVAAHE